MSNKYREAEQRARDFLTAAGVSKRQQATDRVARYYARLNVAGKHTDGTVYPSATTVAAALDLNDRTVKRANALLKTIGFMETVGRRGRAALRRLAAAVADVVASRATCGTTPPAPVASNHPSRWATPYIGLKRTRNTSTATPAPPPYRAEPATVPPATAATRAAAKARFRAALDRKHATSGVR